MSILIIGLVLFFTLHSLSIFAPQWRERMRARVGRIVWILLYSLGSVISIGLIGWGYALSRYSPVLVYVSPGWMHHVTQTLMVAVFPLIFATLMPCRIRTALKYPDLVAIKLWAFAHLLANGMLADVVLFGSFLVWAIVNRISLKHRVRKLPSGVPSVFNDFVAIICGLVAYMAIVGYLHYKIIGVAPA